MPGGQSCQSWGENGDDRIPIIINETNFGELGDFNNWFSGSGSWVNPYSSPWYIILDTNFNYINLFDNHGDVINKLDEILD